MEWLTKSAEGGHASSQFILGLAYADGLGVPKNTEKSIHWILKAAEQGLAEAEYELALAYHQGSGVPGNPPIFSSRQKWS